MNDKLKTFEIEFTTGHCRLSRLVRVTDKDLKSAEGQLFKMYCSVNTTIRGSREIIE